MHKFHVIAFVLPGFPTIKDSLDALAFLSDNGITVETALPDASLTHGLAGIVHQTALKNGILSADVLSVFGRVPKSILRTNGKPQRPDVKKAFFLFLGKGGPKNKTIAMAAPENIPNLRGTPLVFLACAKNRGGTLYPKEKIRAALAAIREKTSAPVFAGHGVTTQNMGFFKKAGFDGVFWGSQSVRVQARGAAAFQAHWHQKIQRLIK
ncbi:MAG: hypothetical protein Q8P02_01475 [Candidatus Micrarchaeota archaeon]|nr:hypothetical protein [Candidatus Micrarchaeota archaeon]